MLRNTPAGYKKEYPWLKEVDSLALANVQLHLESAFRKFSGNHPADFHAINQKTCRKFLYDQCSKREYLLQDTHLKLPKMSAIKIKFHRQIPSDWELKSVTVSREPSGKYFASLLFCCESQTVEKVRQKNSLGSILPCGECVYFPQGKEPGILCFTGKQRKTCKGTEETLPL